MGCTQILGYHFPKLGFDSATSMWDAWQFNYAAQVDGFFRYTERRNLVRFLQTRDFATYALAHTGGNRQAAAHYATMLLQAFSHLSRGGHHAALPVR